MNIRRLLIQASIIVSTCAVYPVAKYSNAFYTEYQDKKLAAATAAAAEREAALARNRTELEALGVLTVDGSVKAGCRRLVEHDADAPWCGYVYGFRATTADGRTVHIDDPVYRTSDLPIVNGTKIRLTYNYMGYRVAVVIPDDKQVFLDH